MRTAPLRLLGGVLPGLPSFGIRQRRYTADARRRARRIVWSFPIACIFTLVMVWAGVDLCQPELCHPEYMIRRNLLRDRIRDQPSARLVVVLGSSRIAHGFLPESLPATVQANDRSVLTFNFGQWGAGPVFTNVILDRLDRDGIRPSLAVIEVMPTFFARESLKLVGTHLSLPEVVAASRYMPSPELGWEFTRARYGRPCRLSTLCDSKQGITVPGPFGGPPHLEERIGAVDRQKRLSIQHSVHRHAAGEMLIPDGADRALRESLGKCRERGIEPVLLLTPEGDSFRTLYDPEGLLRFDRYVHRVATEHGVRVVDARAWLPEEAFSDGHHLLRPGAVEFTRRLLTELSLSF